MAQPFSLQMSVTIEAAVERVFAFWSDLESFPCFIPALAAVRRLDEKRSRWVIRAPLDYEIHFDSTIVENAPPARLVWETRHSAGQARGELTFREDGTHTRVDLVFRYALHSDWLQPLARLMHRLGFPARTLEAGLVQIKRQIESRSLPADTAARR